tara:strand:+ start:2586 stop:3677 length:1092 start_codon:yes stop_codon:yes gene_type:complete
LKKVCHITTVHKGLDVRIYHKECITLSKDFEVYLIINDKINQITNESVKLIEINNSSKNRISRFFKSSNEALKKAIEINADIYHLHDPELLRIALKLKKRNKKVIYDAHEDLPRQILTKHWIPKIIRKPIAYLVEKAENNIVKKIDGVISATPTINERFYKLNRNSVNVNNYPIIEEFNKTQKKLTKPQIIYAGGISIERGIVEIIDSLEHLGVDLNLAGKFLDPSLKNKLESHKSWGKVNYKGFLGRKEITELYNNSLLGMVTLYPTKNYQTSLPVKMFEYMAAGLPVIASNFPYWESIIEKYECGICVDPTSVSDITKAIKTLVENPNIAKTMGENGLNAIKTHFNWGKEGQKLTSFYHQL